SAIASTPPSVARCRYSATRSTFSCDIARPVSRPGPPSARLHLGLAPPDRARPLLGSTRRALRRGCLARSRGARRYALGGRYWTCSALRSASIVSSTVRRTVVSNELSARPPLIASATAAIDTLSGASQRL